MTSGSQFNTNCTNFTEADWKSLNLVRSSASVIGTVIIIAILLFLLYYKMYSTLFQRLYLYLIIATLLTELTGVISIDHQWHYERQEAMCVASGFLLAWTYVSLFIFSYEIVVHLLYLVISNTRGTGHLHCVPEYTKCQNAIIEIIYVTIPVVVATVFSLPPLLQHKYGIAGPWCFVRSLNDSCEPAGSAAQIAFYTMYMTLGLAGIIASFVLLVLYFKLSSYREVRYLIKRTIILLAFKFIHIIMIVCSMACRLYTLKTHRHQVYGLWLGHALSLPIGVLAFPLGYLLCFHSLGKTAHKIYRKVATKCCKHNITQDSVEVAPTPTITEIHQRTAPRSDRISQPSYTYFVALHSDMLSETSHLINNNTSTSYNNTELP